MTKKEEKHFTTVTIISLILYVYKKLIVRKIVKKDGRQNGVVQFGFLMVRRMPGESV